MHNLKNKSDQSAIGILTTIVSKMKKSVMPNTTFILIVFLVDKIIFV